MSDKVEYIVAFVNEFAKKHSLTDSQSYRYLEQYKAIDFLDRHYAIVHTLRLEDVISDITSYCKRFGGAIA